MNENLHISLSAWGIVSYMCLMLLLILVNNHEIVFRDWLALTVVCSVGITVCYECFCNGKKALNMLITGTLLGILCYITVDLMFFLMES